MFPSIAFTLFAASQVGTPGPANMAVMATAARYGVRRALPFTFGVILGKQFLIWPLGLGMLELAKASPVLFAAMTYASAAYICYLAWRVAGMKLNTNVQVDTAPSFVAGLIVHPLNPKAWAIIGTAVEFVPDGMGAFAATAIIAVTLFACQIILQPLWAIGGAAIASTIQGTKWERVLFVTLAIATVASVAYAIWGG